MSDEGRALEDLVSLPTIPKEAGRKIAQLEHEFARAEIEQLRKEIPALRSLYAKRNELVASKELQEADFWPRVFANAPAELDEYILATDAAVIGQCLKNLTVERFDVDEQGNGGDPRSVRFVFEFASGDENPYFTNTKLVKDFYYRKSVTKTAKGKRRTWDGYVSAPVRIDWKKDQDLTKGLLDAACDLYDAEQKDRSVDRTKLPEYEKLVKKLDELETEALTGDEDDEADDDNGVEGNSPAGVSFFAWFGYRGGDVTAEQSAAADKEESEWWEKAEDDKEEEEEDDDDEDDDEVDSLEEAEVFPDGHEVAISLAEELWPNALKLYVQSYEAFDDFDDEMDIEELDDEDDEEAADQPPSKKVKT
ncbi:Putative nucleosome assembly protein C36B7,08c [Talaromyces islandicus]|uniref:Putative nucleosome assembly protein C36B7,08c n=1 Tax=Talaromyces islandicus TaxID=28573 RepID=A0A0U1LVX0_TALIS|nr:Putative nucleosome assembly protein C36B7,08c [Talaromyces islandicus]